MESGLLNQSPAVFSIENGFMTEEEQAALVVSTPSQRPPPSDLCDPWLLLDFSICVDPLIPGLCLVIAFSILAEATLQHHKELCTFSSENVTPVRFYLSRTLRHRHMLAEHLRSDREHSIGISAPGCPECTDKLDGV